MRVYVTFQHQSSAKKCLAAMKLGWSPFGLNPLTANNDNCKFDFKGRLSHQPIPLLAVTEAPGGSGQGLSHRRHIHQLNYFFYALAPLQILNTSPPLPKHLP